METMIHLTCVHVWLGRVITLWGGGGDRAAGIPLSSHLQPRTMININAVGLLIATVLLWGGSVMLCASAALFGLSGVHTRAHTHIHTHTHTHTHKIYIRLYI